MKIFWSWQSDSPSDVNKNFIKEALQCALDSAFQDLNLTEAERPEVDHDTKDEPGLVEIVATIFKKIENSSIFVGDVTPIAVTETGKYLPNPNVLIELGFALKTLGHERIILVSNKAFGGRPEDLPFDLRHRRGPISYDLKPDSSTTERKKVRKDLIAALAAALKSNLSATLAQRDSAAELHLIASRPGERSIWLQSDEKIGHQDYFNGPTTLTWEVRNGTRSYIRIIPSGWNGEKPSRHEIRNVPNEIKISALEPTWNGDGGANNFGVIAVALDPEHEGQVHAFTQWFEENGELWGCNAFVTRPTPNHKLLLSHSIILKAWGDFLKRSLAFFHRIGATGPYRAEAGVTGLNGLIWAGENGDQRSSALTTEAYFVSQGRKWDSEAQTAFLTNAYNKLRDSFNQPRLSTDDIEKILLQ